MMYEVTLADATVELIDGVDSFQQEGPMTTFFGSSGRRPVLDCWSTKVASFRTERIVKIKRLDTGNLRQLRARESPAEATSGGGGG